MPPSNPTRAAPGSRILEALPPVIDTSGALSLMLDLGTPAPPGSQTWVVALAVEGPGRCNIDGLGGVPVLADDPVNGLLAAPFLATSRKPDWYLSLVWFRLFAGTGLQQLAFTGPVPVHTVALAWRCTGYAPWNAIAGATSGPARELGSDAAENTGVISIGYSEDAGRGTVLAGLPRADLAPHFMSGDGFMFATSDETVAAARKTVRLTGGPVEQVRTSFTTIVMPADDGLPVEVPTP